MRQWKVRKKYRRMIATKISRSASFQFKNNKERKEWVNDIMRNSNF